MGGAASSYKITTGSTPYNKNLDWVAAPSSKVLPIKADAFTNILALGKGRYGMVFLAKQSARDSSLHVAIKFMPKQTILDFQNVGRLQQEINALQACDHPFIIHCFGGYDTGLCIALVLEFAYGGELYHRLQQVHKMSETEAKFYFCELASAIRYLHDEQNIVYRDLKPENIMIDKEGHIRLCDFGFASALDPAQASGAAPLQDGCGTVMYMAPELVDKSVKTHGYPVDWWALGCVLVELLTGEAPFGNSEKQSKFEIFNRITESPVRLPFLMSLNLKTLIKGLLEKKPDKRFCFDEVAKCSWLKDMNWDDLDNRRIRPPWVPSADTPTVAATNFISWDTLALPTGTGNSAALNYCKDVKLPMPRSSNKVYGAAKKAGGGSTAGSGGTGGRVARQSSKKIVVDGNDTGGEAAADSPSGNPARKRPDSIMVAKERSKGRSMNADMPAADSVKLQRERSVAKLKSDRIKE